MKNEDIRSVLDTKILPYISKPGRYLGNELNVIHKSISHIDIRFLIAFPDLYELGMSSQAVGILYHLLNSLDYVWAERVFAPWTDMEEKLRYYKLPLFSLESFSPLADFDVIGFTLQYELTYTNILNMLVLADIPIWSNQRGEHDPLVIAGGPGSSNPEPLSPFFDAFYIGDAEEGLSELCDRLRSQRKQGSSRAETLRSLADLRGIYVPSLYQSRYNSAGTFTGLTPVTPDIPGTIQTRLASVLQNRFYSNRPLVPLIDVTHDRLAVEIMRGCTEGCRFCNAGMIYRPVRERTVEDLVDYTRQALDNSGYHEVSLLSLSTSDYSRISELLQRENDILTSRQVNISFPSLRLDSFSAEIAAFARSVRKSGFTFAPEAGSERLRRVVNKNITTTDLIRAVELALTNGWKTLKFYFMIGLPTETEEDIRSIYEMMREVLRVSKVYGYIELHVSISPYIPKAHTPFQWERQDTKTEFLQKIDLLRTLFKPHKRIKLNWREPQTAEIECVLGRGDRRLAKVIYTAWEKGARFDGWHDLFNYTIWEEAFKSNGFYANDFLNTLPDSSPLPWDHIDKGVSKKFLRDERDKSRQGLITKDCKENGCYACGWQRINGFRELVTCYANPGLTDLKATGGDTEPRNNPFRLSPRDQISRSPVIVRVHYEKTGYSRFISHLDCIRLFDRALRRTGIRAAYSSGFNPRPKLSFSPALSLGYTSSAEYFDLELEEGYTNDLPDRLNAVLPEGLTIVDIRPISKKVPSLQSSINTLVYRVDLQDTPVNAETLRLLSDLPHMYVTRKNKGKELTFDIKPYIESVNKSNGSLRIQMITRQGKTARVEDILGYLLHSPQKQLPYLPVHRQHQYIKVDERYLTPMEII